MLFRKYKYFLVVGTVLFLTAWWLFDSYRLFKSFVNPPPDNLSGILLDGWDVDEVAYDALLEYYRFQTGTIYGVASTITQYNPRNGRMGIKIIRKPEDLNSETIERLLAKTESYINRGGWRFVLFENGAATYAHESNSRVPSFTMEFRITGDNNY